MSKLNTQAVFPFGKYKGMKIDTIRLCDPAYIVWLVEKGGNLGDITNEVEHIYLECVRASNKKLTDEPQRRTSFKQAWGTA